MQLAIAQSADEVFKKYQDAKRNLQTLTYRLQQIDTFPSGNIWNNTGYCVMKRHESDSLFGFLFKAKRDDVDSEIVFNGSDYYMIDHKKKTYKIERDVHRGILGSPGGQMVFRALVDKVTSFTRMSLTKTDSCLILRFDYPDDKIYKVENRYQKIYLDPVTYLPFYSYHRGESAGTKFVSISKLSKMEVNGKNFKDPFENKDYLNEYTIETPSKETEDPSETLINKPAPDFELTDLNGNKFKLSDHHGKVVVLDFWELWCSPCIRSIPKLKEITKKFSSEKVAVLSIVSDSKTFEKVKTFVAGQDLNYPVLFGSNESSRDYFVYGVPMYVVIDKQGVARFIKHGFYDELENVIKKYL